MKMLKFYKYHGAGDDVIVIDNRDLSFDATNVEHVKMLCNRHFGIGADGIILLENPNEDGPECDFKMVFVNSNGIIGAMCTNGGRCVVHFAYNILKIIKDPKNVKLLAIDGIHEAKIKGDEVKLAMKDIGKVEEKNSSPFLYVGTTPHNVIFVKNLPEFPIIEEGRKMRNAVAGGVTTNFVELKNDVFNVRTYERGIDDEILACGTGSIAVAVGSHNLGTLKENICHIKMPGGDLTVEFEKSADGAYKNIWLTGPVKFVFKGEIEL